ncbi:MAG: MBL fold metallo-hydrolase [Reichenbachiella sp.]|uniref:MBL fold metallo-hydrolase n=1 Tax=Reichenbachiella sp. TaxID=2184521 RepID=UPI003265AEA7
MKNFIIISTIILLFVNCGGDDEEAPLIVVAVSDLVIDDVTNHANASDLQLSFSALEDESGLASYRFFLVKSSEANAFNLSKATNVGDDYLELSKGKSKQKTELPLGYTDISGEKIEEGVSYTGFVMSVGAEGIASVLSEPSNAIAIKQSSIKITYIGNDGVYISNGSKAVIIDALPGDLSGWSPIAGGVQSQLEQGSGDFKNVKVAMVTHAHGDHVSSTSVNRFLTANPDAFVVVPSGLTNSISSQPQLSDLAPVRGSSAEEIYDGIKVKVLHMRHFDLFGNDFSTVDNYGYLVEIGGKKILHLGDVFYSKENFESFDLTSENIDVLLIPTFNALLTSANKDLIDEYISPTNIIGLHLPTSTIKSVVNNIYPDARVFKTSLEFERY